MIFTSNVEGLDAPSVVPLTELVAPLAPAATDADAVISATRKVKFVVLHPTSNHER